MELSRIAYITGEKPLTCQPANIAYQPCTFVIIQTRESRPFWKQGGILCPDHDPAPQAPGLMHTYVAEVVLVERGRGLHNRDDREI